jgi:hypothetical protein
MKGMIAIDNHGTTSEGACKFHGRFDSLSSRIRKQDFVEIWNPLQQALGQYGSQPGSIHLDQVWQIAVEDTLERRSDHRMVAADGKHAETAQQVKIPRTVAVIEILPFAAAKADIKVDRLKHPHQLVIAVPSVQLIAIALVL